MLSILEFQRKFYALNFISANRIVNQALHIDRERGAAFSIGPPAFNASYRQVRIAFPASEFFVLHDR